MQHVGWSLLQPVESLVVAHGLQPPDEGWNLGPLQWERRVLAPEPPGESQLSFFRVFISSYCSFPWLHLFVYL